MRGFLHRGDKFQPVTVDDERLNQPQLDGLWQKCPNCGETLYSREVEHNLNVCPKCDYHFRLGARERIALLLDEGSFEEWDTAVRTADPLGFIEASATELTFGLDEEPGADGEPGLDQEPRTE